MRMKTAAMVAMLGTAAAGCGNMYQFPDQNRSPAGGYVCTADARFRVPEGGGMDQHREYWHIVRLAAKPLPEAENSFEFVESHYNRNTRSIGKVGYKPSRLPGISVEETGRIAEDVIKNCKKVVIDGQRFE